MLFICLANRHVKHRVRDMVYKRCIALEGLHILEKDVYPLEEVQYHLEKKKGLQKCRTVYKAPP